MVKVQPNIRMAEVAEQNGGRDALDDADQRALNHEMQCASQNGRAVDANINVFESKADDADASEQGKLGNGNYQAPRRCRGQNERAAALPTTQSDCDG